MEDRKGEIPDKIERGRMKAQVTKLRTSLTRYIAEDDLGQVKLTMEKMKASFAKFEEVHERFQASLEEGAEADESETYFNNAQDEYVASLIVGKEFVKTFHSEGTSQKPDPDKASQQPSPSAVDFASYMNLPKVELEPFDGDPLQYRSFLALFDEHVHRVSVDEPMKLSRLLQYTTGKAKEAIRYCALMEPAEGYEKAREILARRFGDHHIISDLIIKQLKSGKPVRNATDLRSLSDDLSMHYATLKSLEQLHEIDTQSSIVDIVARLQPYVRTRWKKYAMEEKRSKDRYPGFHDLVLFIGKEAEEANDPVYGQTFQPRSSTKSASCLSSVTTANSGCAPKYKKRPCVVCAEDHHPFYCPRFKSMKPVDRLKFVREKKLCENCLLSNHIAADCRRPAVCSVTGCGKKHTKFLHIDEPSRDQRVESRVSSHQVEVENAGAKVSKSVCVPVVPVLVNNEYETVALLDSGSTNTFCTRKLVNEMGIKGHARKCTLSTLSKSDEEKNVQVVDLYVSTMNRNQVVKLSQVFVIDAIPASVPDCDLGEFEHLRDLSIGRINGDVNLLIGQDHSEALLPLETRKGQHGQPFAVRTILGWSLNGPINSFHKVSNRVISHFVKAGQIEDDVQRLWSVENEGIGGDKMGMSLEDKRVFNLWENQVQHIDKHFQLPVPLKESASVPNNFAVSLSRLHSLKGNLMRRGLFERYADEIVKLCAKGYAEKIPVYEISADRAWYLPHQAVISDNKPGKIRVVFDCSSKFHGESLNEKCYRGPDLVNKLMHVLLRFRNHEVALSADIEAMYYQVRVTPGDKDLLRFIWFDPNFEIEHYRMLVHVFGGIWSGSAATYALRKSVDEFGQGGLIDDTILNSFYVDDCLASVPNINDAAKIISGVKALLAKGGFNLTKFVVNDERLLSFVDDDDMAPEVKDLTMDCHSKVLGLKWDVKTDDICFDVNVSRSGPVTRRVMLSTVSSLFDPLGLVTPILIPGKLLFQEATRLKLSWDDHVPSHISDSWHSWLCDLEGLKGLKIPRCVKPVRFNDAYLELHHFSDASERAYGCCSYIRCVNKSGEIHTSLLVSKSRVAPINSISIARLELQAALLAARMDSLLREELHLDLGESRFWVDSELVLKYIFNDSQRFHVYVSNRVSEIRQLTKPNQWSHISGAINISDLITRGTEPKRLMNSAWLVGPDCLRTYKSEWQTPVTSFELGNEDPEVKVMKSRGVKSNIALVTDVTVHPIDDLINHYSSWSRLIRATCFWLRLKGKLSGKGLVCGPLSVQEIELAESIVIKHVQGHAFAEEIKQLSRDKVVGKSSRIKDLLPMLDDAGLLRVGGRIGRAAFDEDRKHPVLIPHESPIAKQIARDIHNVAHLGVEWSLSFMRAKYWVTRGRNLLKSAKRDCFLCKKMYDSPSSQRMADLPPERLVPNRPPFSFVGTDCFGPILVKSGRSQLKRYGCIFSCFTTRAIHIEMLRSMDTDSMINALRRFMSRRGDPKKIWSDNGSNYVGCFNELTRNLKHINQGKLRSFCTRKSVEWVFNPPGAPHMGGVFERMVKTVKRVLGAVLNNTRLTDEILSTVLCEVESVVNSRPITKVSDDVCDPMALTPNHFLILNCGPPHLPGEFQGVDIYRRRWRHVQHLLDIFWKRWIKNYLPLLQKTTKWHNAKENLKVNDLVLITDDATPRGLWPMGVITNVKESDDGLVRSVCVRTKATEFWRPVTKLVLLEGSQ